MKLEPEVKRLWLKALRSGDYKQSQYRLMTLKTNENGDKVRSFCCLGVLCDVAIREGFLKTSWGVDIDKSSCDDPSAHMEGDSIEENQLPPIEFAYSIGIHRNPILFINGKAHETADLNDHGVRCECDGDDDKCEKCNNGVIAYDFLMIADLIEEQL